MILRKRCPNTELFLVHIFLSLDWIRRNTPHLSVFRPNLGKYGPDKIPSLNTFHAKQLHVLSSLSLLFNLYSIIKILSTETHSEACQTSKVELFAKLVTGFQPLNVFTKCSILDVWLSSEYACEIIYAICMIKSLQTISNIHPRIHKKITIKTQRTLIWNSKK